MGRAPNIASVLTASLVFACSGGPVDKMVTVFDAGDDTDAGTVIADAGPARDGGPGSDAGEADAGERDANVGDSGMPRDASEADAGDDRDTGVDPDAGAPDANAPPMGWTQALIDDDFTLGEQTDLIDIDDDGDLDVVVSMRGTAALRLHVNGGNSTGGGTGSVWTSVNVAPLGSIVAVSQSYVDLNNDQRLDVLAVGLYQPNAPFMSASRIAWYEQPATALGAWTEHIISDAGVYGVRAVAVGDLTGDNLPDIVIGAIPTNDEMGQPTGDGLFFKRNLGGAAFSDAIVIDNTISAVEVIRIVDVDMNGADDIVASGRGTNELTWYENTRLVGMVTDAPVFAQFEIAALTESNGFALGQLDADAAIEIVVGHDDGVRGAIAAYDPPADPRMPWTRQLIDPSHGGPQFETRLAITDLNQDGMNDVVAVSRGAGALRAYTRTSTGGWFRQTVTSQLTGLIYVDTGDVDGDTYPDLITVTQGLQMTRDELTWWRTQP